MTATDAARLLGCSLQTVKRLAERGEIPTVRFMARGHVRFRLRDIEEFIERKWFCDVSYSRGRDVGLERERPLRSERQH